jgi:quinol monooxygenase YgiN
MTQDVTVTFEITLKPEAAEGFGRMGGEGLQATRDFPGCREVRIVRHKEDSCRFLFIERWESEEAYRSYIAWRTERGEFQGLQAMATRIETDIWPQVVATT